MVPHTVAITGGAGFVMGGLVRTLLHETAWHCRVIVRPEDAHASVLRELEASRVTVVPLDVSAASAEWQRALQGADGIVHGAAVSPCEPGQEAGRMRRFVDVNVSGTIALCTAAHHQAPDARIVQVSSVAVYGHPAYPTAALAEDDEQEPVDAYDITKYAAERLALRFAQLQGQDLYVVRLTRIFGRGEQPTAARALMSLPRRLADTWARGETFRLTSRSTNADTDLLPVESAADAIRRLLTGTPSERVFNLGGGGTVKVAAVIALAQETLPGLQVVVDDDPGGAWDADPDFARGKDGVFDIGRATRQLGWRPPDVTDSLRSYFQYQLKTRG